ncbi:SusC/RagA family TonB-linked outer membrane protein [Sphingobacterium psychroaquaticum]|uniref:TonB-linked outer membrane protein, SusC/RagA family n=1 Tax=Sphingobacterium psychroaquaticum TaxID=561061 RepID=A0A1X7LCF9_9SPHI|nr:SusC/RagA family TonB-linked outer membrane protein [Sphingobacterium psychroaquaticum]SMG51073.1 TonB-linked outer membrane protein, SusC/RagA family [Sphingobacterium psychroaquaticum]
MKRIFLVFLVLNIYVVQLLAQEITLTGVIRDEQRDPIAGATLSALPSGKRLGLTSGSGAFSVKAPAGTTSLRVNHMNYNDVTIRIVAGKTSYEAQMKEQSREIETVTVGYVARKKETLTGSAVVIKAKDIKDAPAANFTDLLQGRVSGLNVQLNTGTPGVRGSMSLRGLNSANVSGSGADSYMTNTSPLFVIDGVPVDEGNSYEYGFQTQGPGISPISMIPTEDIEDITILKDAQATAQYGSKGAYGVILVTTKRGNSKIPIVSWNSKYFVNTVPTLRSVIGGVDERRMRVWQILANDTTLNSALDLINRSPGLADSLNAFYNNSTNWQSYFYGNTVNMQQALTISGGDQTFNYKVAPGYYKENGIIQNTGFTRYTMNTNMQYRPSTKFFMAAYMNVNMVRNSMGSGNAYEQSGVASGSNTTSLAPSPSIFSGSYDALAATNVLNDNKTAMANTQVQLEYQLLKSLRATSTLSYNYNIANQDRFTPEILNSGESMVEVYNDRRNKMYNRNMLQFNTTFGDSKHLLNAYFFNEVEVSKFRAESMRLIGTGSDRIQSGLSYNTRYTAGGVLDNLNDFKSASYAGQLMYQLGEKYIFEVSYRLDGNSNRGSADMWSENPSVGLRWNFGKEEFMAKFDWLSSANLRTNWGRNTVPTGTIYDAYGKYVMDASTYNGQPTVGLNMKSLPNVNLEPIVTTQWNTILDLGFLNDRLTLTYENYYKQVDKELVAIKLANMNAFEELKINEQSIVNMGHELSVFFRPNFHNTKWRATFYANGSLNKDYLTDMAGDFRQELIGTDDQYVKILKRLGRNTLSNVLYHYKGVYQSDSDVPVNPATGLRYRASTNLGEEYFFRAGDPIFTDLNGDYILDERDLVIAGNSMPRVTGGFGGTIQYKGWSLQTAFSYTLKRDIVNSALADRFRNYYNPVNDLARVPISDYDYYTSSNPNAMYPNPFDFRRSGIIDPFRRNSTLFQEDGSYLKFQSATLSYNFDREKLQKLLNISGLRLLLTASNIYTFSKYSGPDPELVTAMGFDNSNGYPRARSFTFGLDVQF